MPLPDSGQQLANRVVVADPDFVILPLRFQLLLAANVDDFAEFQLEITGRIMHKFFVRN